MLTAGTRLGPYEIIALLGAGGMGEVFRARDTRLDRSVAIKMLPADVRDDALLKARFESEAKIISQLNHPNICTLYDVGENFFVMELLEGESLAQRLKKGPLPVADVLKYGVQIADALDKAHRAGIVHRDLKPANIMLTKSGAKLLDFGLAKVVQSLVSVEGVTAYKPMTEEGAVLGTFQYMAPEQIEGHEADVRTDIFAFAAVVYEMLTAQPAFDGRSRASLVAAILGTEPPPIRSVRQGIPASLERLVKMCLSKDPDRRLQSAHDVGTALVWIGDDMAQSHADTRPLPRAPVLALVAALLICAVVVSIWALRRPLSTGVLESEIRQPSLAGPPSLSPDGKLLAFQAPAADGRLTLWIRPLHSSIAKPVAGTPFAAAGFGRAAPVWGADSATLLFVADGALKRLTLASGAVESLFPVRSLRGAAVNRRGLLLLADDSGLVRVANGQREQVTRVNRTRGEIAHQWPSFLPDGDRFLYSILTETDNVVHISSLSEPKSKVLLSCETGATYAQPGYVLCVSGDRLLAYQLKAGDEVSEPREIAAGVGNTGKGTRAWFSVSDNGILVFTKGALFGPPSQLTWFDRQGRPLEVLGPATNYFDPALSHDGTRVAVRQSDEPTGSRGRIVIYDVVRKVPTVFATGSGIDAATPVWSHDDRSLYFSSGSDVGVYDIFRVALDGGSRKPVIVSKERKYINDISPNGRDALVTIHVEMGIAALGSVSLGEGRFKELGDEKANQSGGKFSPDGKWIAFEAVEKNRKEIFVASFPEFDSRVRVSNNGGGTPQWSRDGTKLYYVQPGGAIVEADVRLGMTVDVKGLRVLFTSLVKESMNSQFAVTAKGERFLVNVPTTDANIVYGLVQDWPLRLKP